MKKDINLLPQDLGPNSQSKQLNTLVGRFALIVGVLILLLGAAGALFTLYLSGSLNASKTQINELSSAIAEKETVEQQYILVKDRVDKARPILSEKSAGTNLSSFQALSSLVSGTVSVTQAEITSDKLAVTYEAVDARDYLELFTTLSSGDVFKDVTLKSFSFSPATGYSASLEMLIK